MKFDYKMLARILLAMALGLMVNPVHGQVVTNAIAIANGSFEIPAGAQGTVAGVPAGWTASNNDPYGVYNPGVGVYENVVNDILPSPAQGSQVLWMNAGNYLAQFLTNTLAPNKTYTLSGAIGNRGDGYGLQPGDQDYVNLVAGGTIIAQNANLPHPALGSFLKWTISYTSPATGFPSGQLEIRIGQNGTGEVNYDNISLTVSGAGTASTTTLASSQNPASFGSVVTFTATVSGSGGTPSGTVVFYDGTTSLGSGTLNGSGIASFSASALLVAGSPHSITAVYGGDGNFGGSTSSALSEVITVGASTTAISSSQNPAGAGGVVTFTATVSGSGGTPSGTVVFYDGANNLGSGTLNSSGIANFSTSALSVAGSPHSITAVYGGDSNFGGSTSSTLSQAVINLSASTTTIASSQNPAAAGSAVTFSATVSGSGGTPTGTVVFYDGANNLGSGTLNGSGMASFSTSALSASGSPHSMTAVYGGNSTFAGSSSSVLSQTITNSTSTTAGLSARWPFSEGFGTITADSSGNGNIGTLKDSPLWVTGLMGKNALEFPGATVPGAAYVTASNSATLADQGLGSNITISAWVKRSPASLGTYCSVVAKDIPSDSAPYHRNYEVIFDTAGHIELVYRNSAGTAWEMYASSATYTDTANWHFYCVTYTYGNASSCTFYVDGAAVSGGWISGNGSDAPASTSGGPVLIGIDGTGTASHGSIYNQISIYGIILSGAQVNALYVTGISGTPSATTLASSQNPASFGSVVTFTATVSGSGGTPSGTVVFYDGATSLGSGTLNGSGIASFSASALSVAGSPHSITAVYGGDGNFGGSTSSALSEVITVGASTTAISSSQNPAGAGGVVTFTATVSGSGGTPTGTVVFYDGAANLGSGTLNSSGIASFSTSALSVAGSPHSITAVYGGDSNFGGSTSSTLSQAVINLSASTTTIASSQNPAAAGSAVTFSATVSGSGGTPTGTVVFYDGANNLGSGTLNGSGMASFSTSALSASGSPHSMTAVYGGNSTFAGSSSSVLSQTITNSTSTTAGLSARWPFSEGSGTITADSSGNGNTGTLKNSPLWVTGLMGKNALEFPGATVPGAAYVTASNSATLADQGLGSNITISAWVKRSPASLGTYCSVVAKDIPSDSAPYHRNYEVIFDTAGHIELVYRNSAGTAWEMYASSATYTDTANWHFYCVTYTYGNASSCTFYVDGAAVSGGWISGNGSDAPASTSGGPVLIGIDGTGTASHGSIYNQISIYGIILSGAQVNALYVTGISGTPSTTTLASSQNPASFGSVVTFTATVSGSGGTPSGTVVFYDGTTSLGSGALNGSGIASFSASALLVAGSPHSITAVYGGDGNFGGSTSSALSEVITVGASTTAISSSQNPAGAGGVVTFTATVSGSGGTPSGTVVFYDGANNLGSGTLNSSGIANFSTSALSVAGSPHSITAVYGGDSNFGGSTSSTLSQAVINLSASTTTIASSQNPAAAGSAVTFSATVSGSGGTPTGTVVFYDGANNLGSGTLNGSGMASFSTSALSASGSPHSMTAVYGGNSTFAGSSSSVLSQTITNSTSTTAGLSARWPFSEGFGTITADSSGNGNIGTLKDSPLWVTGLMGKNALEFPGATVPGAAYVTASNSATLADQGLGSNITISAWVKRSPASLGTYCSVVAKDIPSDSAPYHRNYEVIFDTAGHIELVYRNSAGTAWEMYASSATYTDTANWHFYCVTYTYGNASSCTFYVDGAAVSGGWISGNGSDAPASTSGGPVLIGIDGTGTASHGSIYNQISIYGITLSATQVNALYVNGTSAGTASTTTIASSQNPASFGSVVTFTATVSGSGGTPSGTVVFYDGANNLGGGTLNGSGIASFSTSALSVAGSPHSITAVYGGDGNFGGSMSSALLQTVGNLSASTTTIASSQNPAAAGSSVTFTATVTGSGGTPTGTVVFYDGANNLGSGTLNSLGLTALSTAALSASGSPHAITAVYGGDSNFGESASSTLSQTITNLSASATTIISSQNPAGSGGVVTFTATVSGSGGTPTGTVVFYDGATSLGSGTLNSSGVASFSTSALSVAGSPHSITAVYGGDSNFGGSTSITLSQTIINLSASTTTIASSQNPAAAGSAVTFSATVSGSGGTPTGTVVFYDGANNLGSGTLNGSGMASFSTSALSASGSPHSMTAVYSGNSTFAGSSSSVLLQSVLTSTTILTTSQNPAAAGSVVTFTATVSGSGGTPTGTVVFYDGTSSLGNGTLNGSGVAALSTAALSVGGSPHSITAIYGGNSTFGGSSSGVLSQSILNPTTTALTSSQNPAQAGSVVTFTATVSGAGGIPTGTVVFNDGGSSLGSGTLNGSGVASFGTSALSASGSPHSMTAVYTGNGTFAASSSSVLSQTITNSNTNISFTVTNGLSARWSFDEGFGAIVADSSGNGNTGTLNDSPVWVAGLSGNNALEFPGSIVPGAAYVSVPNSATLADQGLGSNITICAWVKRSPASIGTYSSVVAKDIPFDSAPYHRNYELIFDSASHVDFAYRNSAGTTWETYASEPIYPDTANWHFYCVTYTYGNASSCTFYVDGSEVSGSWTVGNGSDAPASTSGGPVLIGIDGTGTTSSGSIYQQISIYNVALPASVVLELYTNAISGGLASATTVTSSQNPALAGGEVTFRATVSGNGGTPTGAVIFYDGTNSLGMGTLNSSGVASLSTGALSVTGLPHAITVVYDGDGVFGGSSSSVLSQIVINASTTAVTSSQNPAVAGNAVTFTATVTGSGGMPTGTVVFYDGVNDLGSVNLNASSVAVLSTSALSVVGSPHSITAVYSGDTNFEGSSSSVLSQIILSASTTTLTSSQNPAPAGSVVTFSATVRGSGGQPTGTVVFFDGSSNLGIGTLNGGVAVLSTSALSVGGSPHSITAVYSGDSAYGVSSSSVLSQDITTPSTITIASLQNPAPSGSVVTFAATVAGSGGVPTGNVDFYDGTSSLGIVGLNGLGVAVFSTSALSVGGSPHAIMAVYGGDSAFGGSTSSVLSQVISNFSVAPSAITVSSSQNPAPVGSMVSLSATVSGAGGTPTGTVVFFDGNNDLGSETLNGLGVASLSTSALSASGSPHAITAVYGGNSAFGGSSSSVLSQIITNLSIGASSIMISSSQNPALPGSAVTFIATVSGSSGVPAGTVNFFDGANSLGTGTLNNLGVTALSTAALSTGGSPHAITAVYAGNSYFASSKSSVLSQIISSTSTGASNIWELTQRLAYTAVPVADFRPTVTNSVMVVDEMPNGNPTDAGNGVVWDDLCLEDCFTNDATVVHALHVATHSNFMEISSQAYNGGEPLPLLFGQGYGNLAFTTMAAGISGNIFYAYNGIGGVTDGSSAAPGTVGEFISSSRTDYLPLTTGTTVNIAAINLTAGDWDVEGVASFVFFNSATVLSSSAGISTVSATNPSDGSAVASGLQLEAANMTYNSIPIFSTQLSFSSTTTVYLVGTCFFTAGDVSAFGQITARRMR